MHIRLPKIPWSVRVLDIHSGTPFTLAVQIEASLTEGQLGLLLCLGFWYIDVVLIERDMGYTGWGRKRGASGPR